MRFYDKLMILIKEQGVTKNKLLTDLNLNRNSIQNWQKQGSKPRTETMAKIAEYFNVSAESLADDSIELQYEPSVKKSQATKLLSFFQRSVSLSGGYILTDEKINKFSRLLNASIIFLTNLSEEKYCPEKHCVSDRGEFDVDVLLEILKFSDRCSDDEITRVVMIQISKILLYRIENYNKTEGYDGKTDLYSCNIISKDKLDFLYTNKPSSNIAMNFGFNYTEITAIQDYTKMSYHYLFTGKEKE